VKVDESRCQEMARYRLAGPDFETPTTEIRELAHRKLYCVRTIVQGTRFLKQRLASFGSRRAEVAEDFRNGSVSGAP
jgi:hypothetical protein